MISRSCASIEMISVSSSRTSICIISFSTIAATSMAEIRLSKLLSMMRS